MDRELTDAAFGALMAPWGPWGRRVAVAVSGGADSVCLALLASRWGQAVALTVDHGLRPESAAEARAAVARLASFGVAGRVLTLRGLSPGPGVAARARAARYAALEAAALEAGCVDLLLAHHLGDQAETLLMRRRAGSGAAGLACMAAVAYRRDVRVVRPLLGVAPERLRATLRAAGVGWAEDPSNRNMAAERARVRAALAEGGAGMVAGHGEEAARHGAVRRAAEGAAAAALAAGAGIYPEGYAVLAPGPVLAGWLAALVQSLGGAAYPPGVAAVARLAGDMRPAVLAGVRVQRGGRLGAGWLLTREVAAMAPPVPAVPGAVWDGRFRLSRDAVPEPGAVIAAVGREAARLRRLSPLPAAVLQTLPGVWINGALAAVPHIGYPDGRTAAQYALLFCPARPAAGAPFGA